MPRINLSGGTYQSRSAAVAAQRCLNLYPEPIPAVEGEPIQFAFYPTAGTKSLCDVGYGPVRCLYTTSQGDLIAVAGPMVVLVGSSGTLTRIGIITGDQTQVRMQDNGLTLFIVTGSKNAGWYCSLPTATDTSYGELTQIIDDAFYGSQTVAVIDTFLLFTQPDSNHWYVSPANFTNETDTPFDSLYIASKTSYPDQIIGLAVLAQSIWIFGQQTTEVWYNSGAADFPFQRNPSVVGLHGCIAAASIAHTFGAVYWLGRDPAGQAVVFEGQANTAESISSFPITQALQSYGDLSDAIGHTYQQGGHRYYVLTLPSVGKTWVYDAEVRLWHERCGLDADGNETGIRANCWASAYGRVYCGDRQNGVIYEVSPDYLDDAGTPIKRQRAFPHLLTSGTRGIHRQFTLDMQNGSGVTVDVDWSDDRGATFGAAQSLALGATGNVWPTLWRLGMARDRVYRITWTGAAQTALMGAFINVDQVKT